MTTKIKTGISLGLALALSCAGARAEPPKETGPLLPSGTTALPAGQYLVTNLASGQTLFVYVNGKGQMLSQEPRLMHISAQHGQIPGTIVPTTAVTAATTAATTAAPAATTAAGAAVAPAAEPTSLMQQIQQKSQDPKFRSDLQSQLQKQLKRNGPKIEREIKKLLH